MTYPSAPWTLRGFFLQTLHPIEIERIRPLLPSQLSVISVFPGKTLGGVYLSYYDDRSALSYNELVIIAAIARYGHHFGSWISHIYVDNPDSVAGGRQIWGLPKQLATFTWEKSNDAYDCCVSVTQADRQLCRLSYNLPNFSFPLPLLFNNFSTLNSNLISYSVDLKAQYGFVNSKLDIPSNSPFQGLKIPQPWLSIYGQSMQAVISTPQVLSQHEQLRDRV